MNLNYTVIKPFLKSYEQVDLCVVSCHMHRVMVNFLLNKYYLL